MPKISAPSNYSNNGTRLTRTQHEHTEERLFDDEAKAGKVVRQLISQLSRKMMMVWRTDSQ